MNHIVQETFPDNVVVESVVFPAYEVSLDEEMERRVGEGREREGGSSTFLESSRLRTDRHPYVLLIVFRSIPRRLKEIS